MCLVGCHLLFSSTDASVCVSVAVQVLLEMYKHAQPNSGNYVPVAYTLESVC